MLRQKLKTPHAHSCHLLATTNNVLVTHGGSLYITCTQHFALQNSQIERPWPVAHKNSLIVLPHQQYSPKNFLFSSTEKVKSSPLFDQLVPSLWVSSRYGKRPPCDQHRTKWAVGKFIQWADPCDHQKKN